MEVKSPENERDTQEGLVGYSYNTYIYRYRYIGVCVCVFVLIYTMMYWITTFRSLKNNITESIAFVDDHNFIQFDHTSRLSSYCYRIRQ